MCTIGNCSAADNSNHHFFHFQFLLFAFSMNQGITQKLLQAPAFLPVLPVPLFFDRNSVLNRHGSCNTGCFSCTVTADLDPNCRLRNKIRADTSSRSQQIVKPFHHQTSEGNFIPRFICISMGSVIPIQRLHTMHIYRIICLADGILELFCSSRSSPVSSYSPRIRRLSRTPTIAEILET